MYIPTVQMLPCNAYPGLKKYPHLIGKTMEGPWQDQAEGVRSIPRRYTYDNELHTKNPEIVIWGAYFTTGLVQWPGRGAYKGS